MEAFSIKVENCNFDKAVIIKPTGSIDSTTTDVVEKQLFKLINNGTKYIITDFSEVTFISSSGVGTLLASMSFLRENNGDLMVMNVSERVKDIFDILNINDYFITIESVNQLGELIPTI
jgi:anti-sigma B factor antagonist